MYIKRASMRITRIPSPKKLYSQFFYFDRVGRAEFVCQVFEEYIKECRSVLDVGGWEGHLCNCLVRVNPEIEYVNLDIAGKPDIVYNLEVGSLPFPDNTFDLVVCTDVLEHIDDLHMLMDDIVRVAKKYIIISLPNMFSIEFRIKILLGKDNLKHYGLPKEKPSDRHKWFFSYRQAQEFIHYIADKHGLEILEEFPYFGRSRILKTKWFWRLKLIFPNLFAMTYWCLLHKPYG